MKHLRRFNESITNEEFTYLVYKYFDEISISNIEIVNGFAFGDPDGSYDSFDAVAIASGRNDVELKTKDIIFKKCVADGDFQLRKGVRSQQVIPVGKIQGFRKFDKVKYNNKIYFIKGRMSTGYALLMGIDNKKIDLKPIPKFKNLIRISARKTWLINSEKLNLQTTSSLTSPSLKA